jgi:hypothetical protein
VHRNRLSTRVLVIVTTIAAGIAPALLAPVPSRGLAFTGHGPDPAPPGVDVRRGRDDDQIRADATGRRAAAALLPTGVIACLGDGASGARVQAIYAVAADRVDRSATVVPAIQRTYAPHVDWQFNQSAAETGGEAHPAFVTRPAAGGSGCEVAVDVVHLSASGDDNLTNTVNELRAAGYTRADRKYLVWTDADILCGVADMFPDTRPTQDNRNNGSRAMYARVDTGCWGYAEGHELMHTLGAVQAGAPHATLAGHCFDEPDDMCYNDDPTGLLVLLNACGSRDGSLFDCNHDDYFYAGAPPPSNWLATHWNAYNSRFLIRGPVATAAGVGPVTTSGGTTVSSPATRSGYWMLTADGHVQPFGDARSYGEPAGVLAGARAVHLEPSPTGAGYWILDDRGHVHAYGDAIDRGEVGAGQLSRGETVVGLSAAPTGGGYWIFSSRGRVFTFGDTAFFGDMSGARLNGPVVGSVATPSGRGYYLFASDGGIFSFGDAVFHGSTGNRPLNRPVMAMAPAPGGAGYWLVASDGGVFAFDAPFYGSMGNVRLNQPVSAMVPGEHGYLMVGGDGGVFSFGDVAFHGSLGDHPPAVPVVSVALLG